MGRVSSFVELYKATFNVELNPRLAAIFIKNNPDNYLTLSGLCPLRLRLAQHIAAEIGAVTGTINKVALSLQLKRHEFFIPTHTHGQQGAVYLMRTRWGAFDAEQQARIVEKHLENYKTNSRLYKRKPGMQSDEVEMPAPEFNAPAPEIWPEIPTMFRGDAWELWQRVGDWQRKRGFR
jgi:hypothetical protein